MRRETRGWAKVLAVFFLTSQWAALTGCSESLSSLQGFVGPAMGIFQGVAGVSSFNKYDTSDANFAQNRQSWSQVAGGLRAVGGEMQRREAANANLENIPGEVDELNGKISEADGKIADAKGRLAALPKDATPEQRAAIQQEIDDWQSYRSGLQGQVSQLESLWEQSGSAVGKDVTTRSEQAKFDADKARAERLAAASADPNDTWEDFMPVATRDTSGRTGGSSGGFTDWMRKNAGKAPSLARTIQNARN